MNIKLMIAIAVIAIGVGVYGINHKKIIPPEAPPKVVKKERLVSVLIAKSDIIRGELLTRDNTKFEKWPEAEADRKGVQEDMVIDFKQAPIATTDFVKGELIVKRQFITENDINYIDFIIKPNKVPFPIEVEADSIVGGVVLTYGYVDILALASNSQNLANDSSIKNFKDVSLTPVLTNIRVLKITHDNKVIKDKDSARVKTTLILELSTKQVATLSIARRISKLEVHKSIKNASYEELSANAGDVLESYHAIKEFRASSISVK
ncbi:Flp pilus assembly protein CpaB [Vibrio tritonius]|uniref:Flp pilus assembly protein CpaB n=1 Tax=Vibrio tritonius TaxID=1435069 RepID=UPI0008396973|nr:Flp pilus assembly protein CpaB [Vibrio tritonius]